MKLRTLPLQYGGIKNQVRFGILEKADRWIYNKYENCNMRNLVYMG